VLFSFKTTIILLALLGIGAGVATFIENDFGTSTARILVYNHFWYEAILVLTVLNLAGIMQKTKMIKSKAKFIFHFSFIVMLIGAAMTRYFGYEGIMQIKEGDTTNKMISLEPHIHATVIKDGNAQTYYYEKDFAFVAKADVNKTKTGLSLNKLYNNFNFVVPAGQKDIEISYLDYHFEKRGKVTQGLLTVQAKYGDEVKSTRLVGQRAQRSGVTKEINYKDGTKLILEYGSRPMEIPFSIKLEDFVLERYAGSNSPSSYSSHVVLIDEKNSVNIPFHIYMNHILDYNGFKFFQSSYFPDESGTVLSVNHDIGHWPTYFGYFLLIVGLVMNFFDKNSRFMKLTRYIGKMNSSVALAFVFLLSFSNNLQANETNTPTEINSSTQVTQESQEQHQGKSLALTTPPQEVINYLEKFKVESKDIAQKFGHLVVQSQMGRMKPMDTLARDIVSKLTRKSTFLGLEPNQIVLGMLTRPDIWKDIKMLKVKTPKLKKYLGLDEARQYVAFSEIFDGRNYRLASLVEDVNKIDPNQRGTFEKDVIRLDERLNITYLVFFGEIFKVFPLKDDPNNTWYSPMEALQTFQGKDGEVVQFITSNLVNSIAMHEYEKAKDAIKLLALFQEKMGASVMPSQEMLNFEITFNKLDIFKRITLAYLILGLVMLIVAFTGVFNPKLQSRLLNGTILAILLTFFAVQTAGMGMRWYISGHAPWSNLYESLVYIGWSTLFAGVVFFRKSMLSLAATTVMAAIFMFTAHLSHVDPQITNLVPVLKSYWLTIHVSIITGSYGFLALGCMLGFMALILFIFRSESKPHIDKTIKHITAINEAALIIGLSALVVGNFLGGVWANESWGRYWGWDPKETWAYVAIVIYAVVLHLRLIPKMNRPYIFAVTSTLAFSTILMTYFGVNFYLSGMHSYATGDPVPIPAWVYVCTVIVFVVIALAYRKRDLGVIKV
jgi:cytochrome c-type biogenesis protein CcsB